MQLSQFHYDLPPELIAQHPADKRDQSRLMKINRATGEISHHHFYDLPQFLKSGDVLVVNNTRVLPLRLFGKKITGGKVELLLLKEISSDESSAVWETLSRPGIRVGQKVFFEKDGVKLEAESVQKNDYTIMVKLSDSGPALLDKLNTIGEIPTPPYIREFIGDPERYQTVYALRGGSAAAPTAGLHFTPELISQLEQQGVTFAPLTLHVGLGTFLPVKTDNITDHKMHSEWYEVPESTAEIINKAKAEGRRVIAVGTTSARTLESVAHEDGTIKSGSGETEIFIYPPTKFKTVDALITNFHLPESTLLMMISALTTIPQTQEVFTDFPSSLIGKAYQQAIEKKYRFFSFGDAMFIE